MRVAIGNTAGDRLRRRRAEHDDDGRQEERDRKALRASESRASTTMTSREVPRDHVVVA
jgi:hypothetical protein